MTIANIERRLAAIERQLATIQSRPNAAKSQRRPVEILDRIHGTFANDAAFREAARLGRKWRNAQDKKSATPRKKTRSAMIYIFDTRLRQHLLAYLNIDVLDFNDAAGREYQKLLALKLRVGTSDLKIAAIVLALNATLLSRNLVDFRKIPNLRVENWTAA